MVIIKSSNDGKYDVYMMELTVPFETNIEKRHKYKEDKYKDLKDHILSRPGVNSCNLICLEIGSRGIFSKDNTDRLRALCSIVTAINRRSIRRLKFQLEKIAIQASYKIYQNRNNKHWIKPEYLYQPLYEMIYDVPYQ